jgi:hypothetical protein
MRAAFALLLVAAGACEDAVDRACYISDGRVYKPGDRFPYGDGCNACHCDPVETALEPGDWGCTLLGCLPPYVREACEPVRDSECALGPPCGDACCGQGERCVAGACACGDGAACSGGDICGSPDALPGDGCGTTCCAPGSSCD